MPKGLRDWWSLAEPKSVAGTQGAAAFKQEFQIELNSANSSLREATATADPAQRQALASGRNKLFDAYHAVQQNFNGPDDGSARISARRVVEAARATAGAARKLKDDAYRGAKKWQDRQPLLQQLADRIDELERSGDERAPRLLVALSHLQKLADRKRFKNAVEALDQLSSKVGASAKQGIQQGQTNSALGENPDSGTDKLRRGLHTLFLHRYNEKSVKNLANLLAKYPGTVTLAIAPCFEADDGGGDPYANLRTIVARLAKNQKRLRLTVYFGFQNKVKQLDKGTKNLVSFLKDTMHPESNYDGDVVEFVSICPVLEDKKNEETVIEGDAMSSFEKDVAAITKRFDATLFQALVSAQKLEFRRSPGGGVTKDSLKDDLVNVRTRGRDGVKIDVPVTHEYHHKPSDAAGYDTYAIDGPLVYDPKNGESNKSIVDEHKEKGTLSDPFNPDPMTIDEFIDATESLEDVRGLKEVMLWRPTYNMWSETKKGGTTRYNKSDAAGREDNLRNPTFDKHEKQLAKKFLYAGLDDTELPKRNRKGESND